MPDKRYNLDNFRLLEELVNVQKAYQELIQLSIRENRLRFDHLRDQLQSNIIKPVSGAEGAASFSGNSANLNKIQLSPPQSLGHSALGIRYA